MKFRYLFSALAFVLWVGNSAAQSQNQEVFYESPDYEEEWMQPSVHPDRIMLNYGADPTTTASVTWRTNTEEKTAQPLLLSFGELLNVLQLKPHCSMAVWSKMPE